MKAPEVVVAGDTDKLGATSDNKVLPPTRRVRSLNSTLFSIFCPSGLTEVEIAAWQLTL